LPKRFAEKIESKFPVARRERGSAAGCVTDRTGAPGATPPQGILADLDPRYERSEQISTLKKSPFSTKIFGEEAKPPGFRPILNRIRAIKYPDHVMVGVLQEGGVLIDATSLPDGVSVGQYLILLKLEPHFSIERCDAYAKHTGRLFT